MDKETALSGKEYRSYIRGKKLFLLGLALATAAIFILSIALGSSTLSVGRVLAALAGMLGTALGLFSAVPGLSGPSPAARSALLADGLAQALATTVAGLAVALPSYLLHAVFRRRLERLSDELESAAQQLLGALWLQRLL